MTAVPILYFILLDVVLILSEASAPMTIKFKTTILFSISLHKNNCNLLGRLFVIIKYWKMREYQLSQHHVRCKSSALLLTVMQYATLACERPFRDQTFSKAGSQYAINLPTSVTTLGTPSSSSQHVDYSIPHGIFYRLWWFTFYCYIPEHSFIIINQETICQASLENTVFNYCVLIVKTFTYHNSSYLGLMTTNVLSSKVENLHLLRVLGNDFTKKNVFLTLFWVYQRCLC